MRRLEPERGIVFSDEDGAAADRSQVGWASRDERYERGEDERPIAFEARNDQPLSVARTGEVLTFLNRNRALNVSPEGAGNSREQQSERDVGSRAHLDLACRG